MDPPDVWYGLTAVRITVPRPPPSSGSLDEWEVDEDDDFFADASSMPSARAILPTMPHPPSYPFASNMPPAADGETPYPAVSSPRTTTGGGLGLLLLPVREDGAGWRKAASGGGLPAAESDVVVPGRQPRGGMIATIAAAANHSEETIAEEEKMALLGGSRGRRRLRLPPREVGGVIAWSHAPFIFDITKRSVKPIKVSHYGTYQQLSKIRALFCQHKTLLIPRAREVRRKVFFPGHTH